MSADLVERSTFLISQCNYLTIVIGQAGDGRGDHLRAFLGHCFHAWRRGIGRRLPVVPLA